MIGKLDYTLSGEGEKTVVMLHGWGMSSNAFSVLEKQLNSYSKCLIVDFYGFGKSDKPPDYFDTYEYAYQIFLLLKKLDIQKIILVGHSFGGRVAIILSSIFDVDAGGLVLTSSAGLNRFSLSKFLKIRKYKFLKACVSRGMLSVGVLKKYGSADYKKLDRNMQKVFKSVVNQDLSHLLNKIHVKTNLFWAKDDKETPLWICKKIKRKIKNVSAVVYKTGGHFVYLKRWHSFAKAIEDML